MASRPFNGSWIVIVGQAEGNDVDGFRVAHYWDRKEFPNKAAAVSHGFTMGRSDDFNVGFTGGGKLLSFWWMDEQLAEDEETLRKIAAEIGLAR